MTWQDTTADLMCRSLPRGSTLAIYGSAADPVPLDGWSDLDLRLTLTEDVAAAELLGDAQIWAVDDKRN